MKGDTSASHSKRDKNEPIETKTKAKKKMLNNSQSDAEIVVHETFDGDKYIDLGKKKRLTVQSFKSIPLLDIREFYGQKGDEKPGKRAFLFHCNSMDTIDQLFATLDKEPFE
ncbi:uncharacterized protein EV420DRAFT_1647411 [Desarmillaria tabescens]|uniref:Transcriptional coactivator p15 (PC4) C-terminal domain-containing protein n=1 Tax=Armillaria tabescens TaxID=1929756 RepID=A0AA39JTH9_ARMTA|nr:uncharacterized protein EV420DRAFT_1647411 [Desarmillaria tabescens]KAK0448257.1 hypothetical protein EV420DRAFT_1647411 [Desarmillaria tabescens]